MATYLTPNRHGYSVRFSPFNPDRIVVATSQLYGLAGGGTLFVLDLQKKSEENPPGEPKLIEKHTYQWSDGLFDVAWSETNESIVVSASGDGALQLWNLTTSSVDCSPQPYTKLCEHKNEVYSLDWSKAGGKNQLLSASWDCTIKLWDPTRQSSLNTYTGHSQLVYAATFSPHHQRCFASVSGDGTLKLWSTECDGQNNATMSLRSAHDGGEVLSCDWNKFDENLLVTSGSEGLIRCWDLRHYNSVNSQKPKPLYQFKVCECAVRRVRFSPHSRSVLASVGYDFTTRLWDLSKGVQSPRTVTSKGAVSPNNGMCSTEIGALETFKHHSEFVYGLDWSPHRKGQLADCGWDSLVHIFNPVSLKDY